MGDFRRREPLVLNHEVAGQVVATGSDLAGLRARQQVAANPTRPCGYEADTILPNEEASILGLEATTLSAGGGGYNAYDPSGTSSLYTMSGRFVLRYPRRASTSRIFQFKKAALEKAASDGRAKLEAEVVMAGGGIATDPETGRPALFTASGVKVFVGSVDAWL